MTQRETAHSQPLVSIVIPCHNQGRYLPSALASVVTQAHRPIEIVVVNDGSTDDTADIVRTYGSRIAYVEQDNKGVSAARNAGILASKGEFVMLLDADDMLCPEVVAKRLAILRARPEVGLVVGHFREIDEVGCLLPRMPEVRSDPGPESFYECVKHPYPAIGWLLRREVFERCGLFDPLIAACEDWDLLIRVSARYQVAYDATTSCFYRCGSPSASRNVVAMYAGCRRILRKNSILADRRWKYALCAMQARFFESRYLMGRIRVHHTGSEQIATWLRTSLKQPGFGLYSLLVLASYPIWGRRLGLVSARENGQRALAGARSAQRVGCVSPGGRAPLY